jgi:hypothetical protein
MAQTEHDYLNDRLQEQLDYHSKASKENKKKFYSFQFIIILTSALIPIINVVSPAGDALRLISSILGGIIVVSTSLMQLHKYHENWITFRSTQELLKREKYLYLNDAGEYANIEPEKKKRLLVENTESIVSSETSRYFTIHKADQNKIGDSSGDKGSNTI